MTKAELTRIQDLEDEIVSLAHIEDKLRRFLRRKPVTPKQVEQANTQLTLIDRRITRAMAEIAALEGRPAPRQMMSERDRTWETPAIGRPVTFFSITEVQDATAGK